jgi:hypothetical protein
MTASAAFLGPYSGTVIDSQTGKPVDGATVFIYWVKSVPQVVQDPRLGMLPIVVGYSSEMIDLRLVYTNKKGEYKIPLLIGNTGLTGRLESTSIIIYQPGYQAYIKTLQHNNPYAKLDLFDFKEKDNVVKFERIPPNFDHRRHYEEIEGALRGIDEYRNDTPQLENAGFNVIEWEKMIAFDKKVIPYKEELLRRAKWEERRGREK